MNGLPISYTKWLLAFLQDSISSVDDAWNVRFSDEWKGNWTFYSFYKVDSYLVL